MSPTHYSISGVVARTLGRHNSTTALNMLSIFSIIPRTVNFRKDHNNTSLPELHPVYDTVWWKKYGFDQITLTIYGLLKSHSVTDLTPLITHKVPIEKFSAQQEPIKVIYKVWCCVFNVNHLQVVAFLDASGNTVKFNTDKLNDRPIGLNFFWFSCKIDSVNTNPYICQKNLTFSSASAFTNTITMSPPGSSRPSDLPT